MMMIISYVSSIVVWGVILWATGLVCGDLIWLNGWIEIYEDFIRIDRCFLYACIPILRVLVWLYIFYLTFKEKE